MRELYRILFERGMLPDAVARQDPELLFEALCEPMQEEEIRPGTEWFYGL